MSISIVTVTYNSSDKVIPLLESIENQTDVMQLEVIIIDNNSPDSKRLVHKLSNFHFKNKNFTLKTIYRKTNNGFGISCNFGASKAKFDNILFLNPDTVLLKDSLSILLSHAQKNNADICGGKCLQPTRHEIHRTVFNRPSLRVMLFEYSNLGKIFGIIGNFYVNQLNIHDDTQVEGIGGAYFLIKKESFIELGGFDENIFMYLEDVDICDRAIASNMKIIYCPHSVILHIGGASSSNIHRIVHKAWLDSREYYAKKHFNSIIAMFLLLLYKIERIILEFRLKNQ